MAIKRYSSDGNYSQQVRGMTGLYLTADFEVETVVKLRLENSSEVEFESRGGWTALQLAALKGHEGLEQFLVIHRSSEPEDFYGL